MSLKQLMPAISEAANNARLCIDPSTNAQNNEKKKKSREKFKPVRQ